MDAHWKAWQLLEAAQQEDLSAFAELYTMYAPHIYRYLIARTQEHALAEDLVSETFLRALRRINSVKYTGSDVGAWLTTIAHNLLLDHLKSSRSRCEVPAETIEYSISSDSPEKLVIRNADFDQLRTCLNRLTDDQQRCLELRYWHDWSLKAVAAELHRDVDSIKSLQYRAQRRLFSLLTGQSSAKVKRLPQQDPEPNPAVSLTTSEGLNPGLVRQKELDSGSAAP